MSYLRTGVSIFAAAIVLIRKDWRSRVTVALCAFTSVAAAVVATAAPPTVPAGPDDARRGGRHLRGLELGARIAGHCGYPVQGPKRSTHWAPFRRSDLLRRPFQQRVACGSVMKREPLSPTAAGSLRGRRDHASTAPLAAKARRGDA